MITKSVLSKLRKVNLAQIDRALIECGENKHDYTEQFFARYCAKGYIDQKKIDGDYATYFQTQNEASYNYKQWISLRDSHKNDWIIVLKEPINF